MAPVVRPADAMRDTPGPTLVRILPMKICRYLDAAQQPAYAVYQPDRICPLPSITDDRWAGIDWESISPPTDGWIDCPPILLPPIPMAEKILCIGLNYRDHAIETQSPIPTEPIVFSKFNSARLGHGESIVLPRESNRVDYEAELVVVIGKTMKHVAAEDALDGVMGYTPGHDVSARDWQKGRPGGQWLLGKSFDTFAPMGPAITLRRDIDDPSDLAVRCRINGETMQESTTAQLIFDIPTLISHLSSVMTLRPGDVIFTGTPPGVGDARTPPRYLQDGDRVEIEIEGCGTLSNPVVNEPSPHGS